MAPHFHSYNSYWHNCPAISRTRIHSLRAIFLLVSTHLIDDLTFCSHLSIGMHVFSGYVLFCLFNEYSFSSKEFCKTLTYVPHH